MNFCISQTNTNHIFYLSVETNINFLLKITDLEDLTEKMDYYLKEHNMISKSPMNLVMFKFAIEHVSRVSRVLLQDNGNVMLVGIGGSGRHSSVKLAAFMSEYNMYEVITKLADTSICD